MDHSDRRKGQNEAWFRNVNERLEHRAATAIAAPLGLGFGIVCECAVEECNERIQISFADYESVRGNAKAFVVVAGHTDASCERVVESRDGYQIVEKFGIAGEVAESEDPRND